ncbi:MAG: hypothetical protein K0R63_245 [Rickettsiales bacterium]|jgi:hypothetical protein|nr:hypothetical protein [Rickettsiales bacterium]
MRSSTHPLHKCHKAHYALVFGLCAGYLLTPASARAEDEVLLYTTIYSESHTVEYTPSAPQADAFNSIGQNDSLASAYTTSSFQPNYTADRLYHASLTAEHDVTSDAGNAPGTAVMSLALDEESSAPFSAVYEALQLIQPSTDIAVHYASLEAGELGNNLSLTSSDNQWDILTRYSRTGDMAYVSFTTRITEELSFRQYAGIVMADGNNDESENSAIASAAVVYAPSEKIILALESRHAPDMSTPTEEKTEFLGRISYHF